MGYQLVTAWLLLTLPKILVSSAYFQNPVHSTSIVQYFSSSKNNIQFNCLTDFNGNYSLWQSHCL